MSRLQIFLGALVLVLAVGAAYSPAFRAGFIWDDDDYILLNPLLTEKGALQEIWNPTSGRNPQFYPLVFSMFRFEHGLWGDRGTGYHTVNIALHAANVLLLLFLLRRLRVPGAWLVAGLFAVHPIFVESVAWITERKNVLSGFFYLLAAHSYLRFDERDQYGWYGAAIACFLLALFSKTVTASLPIALGLALWWRGSADTARRQTWPLRRSRFITLGIMLALGFAFGMVTRLHEYRHVLVGGGGSVFADLTFWDRLLIAGRAFWFYPSKIVWPVDLAFIYPRWRIDPSALWQWSFPLAVPACAVVLAALMIRRKIGRGPAVAAAFYAATIFPALGFVNVAPMRFSWVADHFQYLAAIGPLLVIAGAWQRWVSRLPRPLPIVLAVALLATLGWRSHEQTRIYENLGTLWKDTVQKNPDNWIVQVNRGVTLRQQGDAEGAAACYQKAIEVDPLPGEGAIIGLGNLASVRFAQGRYAESLDYARRCLEARPDQPLGLYNLGRALWKLGRAAEAEEPLRALLNMSYNPNLGRAAWDFRRRLDDDRIWAVLADVQSLQGKTDEALASIARALASVPHEPTLHNIKLEILHRAGRTSQAIAATREAIAAVPDPTEFKLQLGLLLAVAHDPADRNGRESMAIAQELMARLGATNPYPLSVLAAAQAELGRFDEAAQTAAQALEILQGRDPGLASRLRAQHASYSRGQPLYHEQ